jgi:hypothetical protein
VGISREQPRTRLEPREDGWRTSGRWRTREREWKTRQFIQVHTTPLSNKNALEACEKEKYMWDNENEVEHHLDMWGGKINDDRRDRAALRRGKWRPHKDCRGREVDERATCARATKASGNAGMSGWLLHAGLRRLIR